MKNKNRQKVQKSQREWVPWT